MKAGILLSCVLTVAYSRFTRRLPVSHGKSHKFIGPGTSINSIGHDNAFNGKSFNSIGNGKSSNFIGQAGQSSNLNGEGKSSNLIGDGKSTAKTDGYIDDMPSKLGKFSNAVGYILDVMQSKSENDVKMETDYPEDSDACKELHDAVEEGHLERVEDMLASGVGPTCLNEYEPPVLVTAVNSPHGDNKPDLAIFQLLINQTGIDVDAKTEKGFTALNRAAFRGDVDIVKVLLDAGADVQSIDNSNYTALMMAIESPFGDNKIDIVDVLIEQPENEINAKDVEGLSALHHAALEGEVDIVIKLLDIGANVNSVDNNNYTALVSVITSPFSNNKEKVVEVLLKHSNIDVNAKIGDSSPPLHHAAYEGELDIVMILMTNGADVNSLASKNLTALMMAVLSPYTDNKNAIVEVLLQHPDIEVDAKSEEGFTALHYATLEGDLDVVEALLKAGADVNSVDRHNSTALMMALISPLGEDKIDIVEVLLQQANIDIGGETVEGYTARDFARQLKDKRIIAQLDVADNEIA